MGVFNTTPPEWMLAMNWGMDRVSAGIAVYRVRFINLMNGRMLSIR
jgi:hypothetical protein